MRLSESKIDNIIRKVVGKSLNEAADYDDNDLEYWSIVSQADAAVDRLEREGNVSYGWKDVAEKMGFRLETLNDADLELIKDAIEQAMLDANDDYWSKDAEFENDFRNMKTESRRRRRLGESELRNIVKSSIKETLLREWGEDKEKVTEESVERSLAHRACRRARLPPAQPHQRVRRHGLLRDTAVQPLFHP